MEASAGADLYQIARHGSLDQLRAVLESTADPVELAAALKVCCRVAPLRSQKFTFRLSPSFSFAKLRSLLTCVSVGCECSWGGACEVCAVWAFSLAPTRSQATQLADADSLTSPM